MVFLPLSLALYFCCSSLSFCLFCSLSIHHSSVKTWSSLQSTYSSAVLYLVFTHFYLPTSACQPSLVLASALFSLSPSLLYLSLPLSSPVFHRFPLLFIFRQVIGVLYLASYSYLNWLAVNFRPPIAKWLISLFLAVFLSRCRSFFSNYCTGRNQPYFGSVSGIFSSWTKINQTYKYKLRAHIIYVKVSDSLYH